MKNRELKRLAIKSKPKLPADVCAAVEEALDSLPEQGGKVLHFYIKKRKKSVIAQNTSTHFLRIITIPDSTLINHHFPYPPIFLSNNVHTLLRL